MAIKFLSITTSLSYKKIDIFNYNTERQMPNTQTAIEEIKVKFDGQTHQIEANTFLTTLLHFVTIVEEIGKEVDSTKKIEVRINAEPKPGSFIVDLMIVCIGNFNLIDVLNRDNMSLAADIIGIVSGIFGLAKFTKGKKPKEIEKIDNSIKIENEDGNVIYIDKRVINIFNNNKTVQHSLGETFETLNEDSNVTGFELHDKEDNILTDVRQEDFNRIATIEDNIISKDERIEPLKGTVHIVSLDWELKRKWEFIYLGNKISAKIKDGAFAENIDKGERFGKGDSLEVEMNVKQEFNEVFQTYVNKSFLITKIISHKIQPKPAKLFP